MAVDEGDLFGVVIRVDFGESPVEESVRSDLRDEVSTSREAESRILAAKCGAEEEG